MRRPIDCKVADPLGAVALAEDMLSESRDRVDISTKLLGDLVYLARRSDACYRQRRRQRLEGRPTDGMNNGKEDE